MATLEQRKTQFLSTLQGMPNSLRISLAVAVVMVVAVLAFMVFRGRSSGYTALSYGKSFSTEEIIEAEHALKEAQLTDFRRDGRQILVPVKEVQRYNAALLERGALPQDWAEEWEKQFEKTNIFTSDKKLKLMKEVALKKELRRVVEAVPAIASANVSWARSENRSSWSRKLQKVTATVSVRPAHGEEITPQLVSSLRKAVANMVPDLKPSDVSVFDQSTGQTFTTEGSNSVFDDRLVKWIKQHTQAYQNQIQSHLSYIPGVVVSVHVDLNDVKSRIDHVQEVNEKQTVPLIDSQKTRTVNSQQRPVVAEPGQTANTPRSLAAEPEAQQRSEIDESDRNTLSAPSFRYSQQEFLAAMPSSVQVSVAIPRDYYKAVALQQGLEEGDEDAAKQQFQAAVDQIKTTVEQDVKGQVLMLIPASSPPDAVDVKTFTRLDQVEESVEAGWMQKGKVLAGNWGGSIGMGLLALVVIFFVYKSMPKTDPQATFDPEAAQAQQSSGEEEAAESPLTRQEQIQIVARDNPELAASILSNWIEPNAA